MPADDSNRASDFRAEAGISMDILLLKSMPHFSPNPHSAVDLLIFL